VGLQQTSTATAPFMRELIVLALIAVLTSNHQIRWVIAAPATQWDNMVDMTGSFDRLAAPVTFTFLAVALFRYIIDSKCPFRFHFACASYCSADSLNLAPLRAFSIFFCFYEFWFGAFSVPLSALFQPRIFVLKVILGTLLFCSFWITLFVSLFLSTRLIGVLLSPFLRFNLVAVLTERVNAIATVLVLLQIFNGCRKTR